MLQSETLVIVKFSDVKRLYISSTINDLFYLIPIFTGGNYVKQNCKLFFLTH